MTGEDVPRIDEQSRAARKSPFNSRSGMCVPKAGLEIAAQSAESERGEMAERQPGFEAERYLVEQHSADIIHCEDRAIESDAEIAGDPVSAGQSRAKFSVPGVAVKNAGDALWFSGGVAAVKVESQFMGTEQIAGWGRRAGQNWIGGEGMEATEQWDSEE